jgi:prevent-host-death family protein
VSKVSVAEVKAHFSDWMKEAEAGEPVVITRHGKPVVALVPANDVEQLRRLRSAGPQQGLASLAGGWEGSDELADRLAEIRRTGPRALPELD